MADQIANYLIKAYTGLVMNQADMTGSVLSKWTQQKSSVRGTTASFGYLGNLDLVAKGSRGADTPENDILHRQYWATLAAYNGALPLDDTDSEAAFTDPKSDYVQKGSGAIGRKWDSVIATAAVANATHGADQGSTETWSTYTDRNSESHVVAATGGSPNIPDILKLRRIFAECEITTDLFAWVSPQFMELFLNITEVKSSDFNTQKVLTEGSLGYYLGFNWEVSNHLPISSTTRSCVFGQRGVVGLAKSIDQKTEVYQRRDKSSRWEVYFEICGGAVRRDPERVIEYTFTES